ncbi:hypothetical protein ACFE04_015154 [Oxalis oulophora]
MPDLHLRKEDDLILLKECVEQYNVPSELRFSLLTRIRYARAFGSPRICRLYSRICLLSFIVLVQSNDSQEELTSFFANEPEFTNELIRIVRSEDSISGNIRTLAMLALGAQLAAYSASHDRARVLSGSSISFAVGNRMILLNVLQRAVSSLENSNDPSSLTFVEALLQFYLLHIVSSSASGSNIRGSGMVPTFLPLLEDSDPNHMNIVYLAVKALQKLSDYSSSAVSLLRESGGVELMAQRLYVEVFTIVELSLHLKINKAVAIGESSRSNEDEQLHSQKRLIKVLLKALGSATYAPANANRPQNINESSLPRSLSLIFGYAKTFGGDIYHSAVTVMSEIIHKDPTCLSALLEDGIPEKFIDSVCLGVLPSAKALTCVPNGLGAICLNTKGLELVKVNGALRFLVQIFTKKKYVAAMNEAVVPLANAVEELLRHASSLRTIGVDIIIEIINKISSLADSFSAKSSDKTAVSTSMEMDTEDKETEEGISDEQFVQLCIFHLMVLLHRVLENTETCRLFVEKSGIETLLKLILRPDIVQSAEGMSIALHSTMVFKGFSQHHSAPLARAFCSSLRDNLKKALTAFSGAFLLDPKKTVEEGVFSPLFVIEFLLFLAASKENRWVTALLTEFGNDSKDVLEDIGRVHREIFWQIALLEDSKVEVEDDRVGSPAGAQPSETNNETENQRFNSFRQFLDPLIRRRTSGWSMESQFFDLISLYHDLGRATGSHQRMNADGSSNFRYGTMNPGSSGGSGMVDKSKSDKQRSYHISCCDMVRSLSFHITHLFQELGKVMFVPSRRTASLVSPTSKSVASNFASIALEHMNFDPSGSEASISTKCRYFGKVVDFIDCILLERPDSCSPVLLNCLYGRGVVHSILTTFEATSQLLYTVNRTPASPMEIDDMNSQNEKDVADHAWIYGPLASYGKLMDHLVTSSSILSPITKHLLAQPLITGDVPFPRDAETFVKMIQSKVLKAVLPVWTHPQFSDCSYEFITTVISIVKHIYSGVEVKNVSSNTTTQITVPPLNESTISTIVEMGFPRNRAEEALRQVGSNSVELAMEWLFTHPEEVQEEDDELARALAMSLGNSESETKEENANNELLDEDMVQLPNVDELLSTCTKLLQMKESLAFPVRDLLLLICSQNDGQYRSNVISFILDQVKDCSGSVSDSKTSTLLCALFHVLALILHEDLVAREIASKNGLVKHVGDLLSQWNASDGLQVAPKWVTTAFLAIDQLLQVDQKLNSEILDLLKKSDDKSGQQTSIVIEDAKQNLENKIQPFLGCKKYIEVREQKRLIEIACCCIRKQLPSETMHAILQLCSTLTKSHSVAVSFLDAGGVTLLLSLPTDSLFPGFDNVAATIIRNILEDPHTLQQAMESEIRQSVVTAANRHPNGRVNPRNFLVNLSSVITRDPVIFMQAAQAVCHIEMVGERPYIVLLKDREKDKSKDKSSEKDKVQAADGKVSVGKVHDSNSKIGKLHRKSPQSFIMVTELLLDFVSNFEPPLKHDDVPTNSVPNLPSSVDMEIDVVIKDKGKAIANTSDESNKVASQDASASLAKIVFIMKLLSETMLMYASSAQVLLRRDGELGSSPTGGIFHHILHKFIPCTRTTTKKEKKTDGDWLHKLATRANQFLVASCVRSAEARRRIFMDISSIFVSFCDSSCGFRPPNVGSQAYVDLLNDIMCARLPTGPCISAEASATFVDVGLVKSLTRILEVLDLDHADSPKVVTGIIKALELVTKERVQSADSSTGKSESSTRSEHDPAATIDTNIVQGSNSTDLATQNHPANIHESVNVAQSYGGGSEAVTDDMEHDQDLGGAANEDDYMQEIAVDTQVFSRDHNFGDEGLQVMPLEVFDSRRQGRSTSIYSLLGRNGNGAAASQHPLLSGPTSSVSLRQSENSRDNSEDIPSRLDSVFRSLRNGRHGQRMSLWMDDTRQPSGSSSTTLPPGLEELVVSSLRRPSPADSSEQNPAVENQSDGKGSELQQSETPADNNIAADSIPPPLDSPVNVDATSTPLHSTEMQLEQNETAARDIEAVSQESGGSGATLGESLRSLDVEIGSADGHDDGMPSSDTQIRARRTNASGRELSLHSVTEVSENSSREPDHDNSNAENQASDDNTGSGQIDQTFLNALPEELRAEVLSAQQGQVAQPSNAEQQNDAEEIDPEFLAALPPDIREEVLAQQRAAQRVAHQSHELEGQPVEMDTVSIIATFPSELREEVLLTSSDAVLANLTPALVAEANMLRERFAHRYRSRTLFGMHARNRRGESSRGGIGPGLERVGGMIASRRPNVAKLLEADGAPLVETGDLQAMIRLLRVVQPLYKGSLQRLLLNLSAHGETRRSLVKILMDMLMLDIRKSGDHSNASEPLYRLYACQNNMLYSRPQCYDGIPPLVSRRVLETLTYLARNHPYVAKILLQFRLPSAEPKERDQGRGKAVMLSDDSGVDKNQREGYMSIALLLSLLNQPLYLRSIAHLEQLLTLLEVIIHDADTKSSSGDKSEGPATENPAPQSASDVDMIAETGGSSSSSSAQIMHSTSSDECDTQSVLLNLPEAELRLLCSLLAKEGLSENAYALVAEVMKKLVAITPKHCRLFITELAEAAQNLTKSAMNELHLFGEAVSALLGTSSSDGAAILRVLQAVSSLVSSACEKETDKDKQILDENEHNASLGLVKHINTALEPLWLELSTCISKIESFSDPAPDLPSSSRTSTPKPSGAILSLPAGTQNILPYIESFFVMCEKLHPTQPGSSHEFSITAISEVEDNGSTSKSTLPVSKPDEKNVAFVKFSEKHRKVLNAFIRQNPGLLEKSLSLMLKVPRVVDFDNKRAHFRSKIKHQHDHHHSPLRISVRRAYILEDSYNQLRLRPTQDLKGRLTVHFQGEEGIDAGGLTREWYQLLSRVIFDKGALLFTTVGNESTFQPNPNSVYQTEHLSYFKFVGRVVGKALFDGQLLDVHFTRSFYKHILGVKVTYHDIEAIDPDYFKNLKWMLENDISDVLDLTFSIDADEEKLILYERTEVTDYELIPGGRNIKVTEENKHEYVDLIAEHRLTTAIRPQINAFMEGFNELISRELISIFNDKELELLISGLPDIDLDDMRANTEYSGYSAASPVIHWFWEVAQGFSKEDKARLLQFVTGTSKVPLEGFSALQGISGLQKFQIHKAYGSIDHLPSAHTCFNQLDLPEYPSKEHLEERLLLAIHEGSEGFGFG